MHLPINSKIGEIDYFALDTVFILLFMCSCIDTVYHLKGWGHWYMALFIKEKQCWEVKNWNKVGKTLFVWLISKQCLSNSYQRKKKGYLRDP